MLLIEVFFCSAIEMYHDQIRWLSQGNRKVNWISEIFTPWIWFKQMFKQNFAVLCWFGLIRQVFGVVNGSRVGVLVDTSDLNCSTERLADLQRELLVGSQMSHCFNCMLCFINLINYTAHFVVSFYFHHQRLSLTSNCASKNSCIFCPSVQKSAGFGTNHKIPVYSGGWCWFSNFHSTLLICSPLFNQTNLF